MLKLTNVCKKYTGQTGQEVTALSNIDFWLPSNGLICILGKSGSGKSTLLNLLGGLDSPTSGEISVDGVSMEKFTKADYDAYRNDYLGFIFQEFNLLADLNVRDNVALSLQLNRSGDVAQKASAALLEVGLNDSYLTRRIGELSGGERQRVAIARCIVKDSKLILADEPTGNLDSATGENIWNILKKISETKLVVVVSHDRDSVERYADRVIEIADGKVVSDTGADEQPVDTVQAQKFVSQKFSFTTALKLGWGNVRSRVAKTVSVTFLLVFCTLALLITQMFLCYSVPRTVGSYVSDYGVPFVLVKQQIDGRDKEGNVTTVNGILKPKTEKLIADRTDCIVNCTVTSSEQLRKLGLEFVGEVLEPVGNSFYVTADFLDSAIKNGAFVTVDGVATPIVREYHSYAFLVGKQVYLSPQANQDANEFPTLCGIIDSASVPKTVSGYMPPIFVSENFGDYYWAGLPDYSQSYNNSNSEDVVAHFGDISYNGYFFVSAQAGRQVAMKEQNVADYVCNDDEIVLSYEMLAAVFDVGPKYEYFQVRGSYEQIVACPEQVGSKLHFAIGDVETGQTLVDLGELTLAGVSFARTDDSSDNNKNCVLSPSNYNKVVNTLRSGAQILVVTKDMRDPSSLLYRLDRRNAITLMGGMVQTKQGEVKDCVAVANNLEASLLQLAITAGVIALILIAVLVLMICNLIGCGISDRQRDIGILSALGTPRRGVSAVFLSEVAIVAAVSLALTICLAFGFAAVCNKVYSDGYVQSLHFFRVDIVTVLTVAASSVALPMLAALIPLRKIAKLRPIDAIRHL